MDGTEDFHLHEKREAANFGGSGFYGSPHTHLKTGSEALGQ